MVSTRPRSPTTDRHSAAGLVPATSVLPVHISPADRQSSTGGVPRDRLTRLQRKLKKLAAQRENRRQRWGRRAVPVLSVVGYTNAGKSTLLRALTRTEVHVADQVSRPSTPRRSACSSLRSARSSSPCRTRGGPLPG